MSNKLVSLALGGALGLLAVPSCDLEIPDLNNPGLEQLQNNPTAAGVNAAATGMLVGNRGGKANATGLVNQLGILGRESYDFDPNDSRFIAEEVQGNLNRGSPFGGVLWAGNFANIRNGNIVIHALDKLAGFDDPAAVAAQKSAMIGFVQTIQGLEFLNIYLTHYDTGAPIDVDHPLDAPLAPFVDKDQVLGKAIQLLDDGLTALKAGSEEFTFPLSPGYANFNTPTTFQKFNRAMRAQAALYAKDYAKTLEALGESFLNDDAATPAEFNAGVFYSYSTNSGDATNGLANRKSVFAHRSFKTDVKMQSATSGGDPAKPDARYAAKITQLATPVTSTNDTSLSTDLTFNMYTSATTPVAVIRNEELMLIKAEALWFSNMHTEAIAELNLVRTKSGKVAAIGDTANGGAATPTDDATFITELLYDRRYSLMYEGGHRWIDLRRFNIPLPLDDASHVRNLRFPVPQQECDARPGEAACNIKSTDPLR